MAEQTQQQQQQHSSLRYLRLQHDFQTMVKTGLSCVDEEVCIAACFWTRAYMPAFKQSVDQWHHT
jgi:hypothetical protein